MEKHINYALEYFPEAVAVRTMRKHLCKYLAGVRGTKELRMQINAISDAETLVGALKKGLGNVER